MLKKMYEKNSHNIHLEYSFIRMRSLVVRTAENTRKSLKCGAKETC